MNKDLMSALYVSYNEKVGVLCDNEDNTISRVLGTDLTLVLDKKDMAVYLLVPLTQAHKFEYNGSHIIVDGKRFDSDIFFRKDACQWIQIDKETLSMVA